MVNKVIQIQNSDANNLCNLLADQSTEFLMDRKVIKGVNHINILLNNSTQVFTKENDSISTLEFWNLFEIATTFMGYAYN